MKHYEYCHEEKKVIEYDVEKIECRRVDGMNEIHWVAPQALCSLSSNAVSEAHAELAAQLESAEKNLDAFEKEHFSTCQ